MRAIVLIIIILIFIDSTYSSRYYFDETRPYVTSKQSSPKKFKNFFYQEFVDEQNRTSNYFQKGNEYIYHYDAQVENGFLNSLDSSEIKKESKQKSITRIKSEINLYFSSERNGQLCMKQLMFGQFNNEKHMDEDKKHCCDPMEMFEPVQLPQETRHKLEICCQFDYVDGMVSQIQFNKEDVSWSKNIKRGVLNMLQLNIQQNKNLNEDFTINELTVEGECQTSYTINKANKYCNETDQNCSFNVTKSINFKKCSKIVDLTNGYQTKQKQLKCAQCEENRRETNMGRGQNEREENVCEECEQRDLNENSLDRETIIRSTLKCETEKQQQNTNNKNCQLKNSEMFSHYVYKNTNLESNGIYGSSMQTKVCSKLELVSVDVVKEAFIPSQMNETNNETLLFSNEWGVACRRFYMFGDEMFPNEDSSPYKMPKVQQAKLALQAMLHSTMNHQNNIKTKHTIHLIRFVNKLRMCSFNDLKQIEHFTKLQTLQKQQKTSKDIFIDSLATCGTRNCLKLFVEIVTNEELDENKVVFAINQLKQLPIPSNSILKQVKYLTQNVNIQNKPIVKQASWLTFGALVNELCQNKNKIMEMAQDMSKPIPEQCSNAQKEEYMNVMLEQFEQSTTPYDKFIALSALGNAGIDISIPYINKIINNKNQHSLIRVKAVDCLRRLFTQKPQTIQQILLPICLNNREDSSVRSAALYTILKTQPEQNVINQIFYSMRQEPNKRVKAYTYQTLKVVAESKNPADKQMAKHVKNAFLTANLNEEEFNIYRKWQIPLFCPQQQEGIFFTLGGQTARWPPNFSYLKMNSYLKESNHDTMTVYLMQGSEHRSNLYWAANGYSSSTNNNTSQNDQYNNNNRKMAKKINKMLGIKSRSYSTYTTNNNDEQGYSHQDNSLKNQQNPLTILCVRIGDIDSSFYSLNQNLNENWDIMSSKRKNIPSASPFLEAILQSMATRKIPNLNNLVNKFGFRQLQNVQNNTFASIFNEREALIPTSIGIPVRIVNVIPMLLNMEGEVNMQNKGKNEENNKLEINYRIMAGVSHVQRIGSWTPSLITGVSSIRSIEVNLPVEAEINTKTEKSKQHSISIKLKMPREETRLFGAYSHQYTYKSGIDPITHLPINREYLTIRNPMLNKFQYQINKLIGSRNMGIPVRVYAHYHWPSSASNVVQVLKMLTSTENAIQFTYQPSHDTSNEVMFNLNTVNFQPVKAFQPNMENFFERSENNNEAKSEEYYQNEMPQTQQQYYSDQQQKIQTFISNYQKTQKHQKHYKHRLELSAKTLGNSKQFKCFVSLQLQCNNKIEVCQVEIDSQRTQMNEENEKWTMKGNFEVIMPVLGEEGDNYDWNQFIGLANMNWGNEQKQKINVRIVGEQSSERSVEWYRFQKQNGYEMNIEREQQMREEETQNNNNNNRLQRRTSFINLFNTRIEYYNMNPTSRNVFERCVEMIKSEYFWNSKTQLRSESYNNPANGKIYCTLSIDSFTQKHANITIITPEQTVYLQQIELPYKLKPFSMLRQNKQTIHSLDQFYSQQEVNSRAECWADGKTVKTFDGKKYNAPLSTNCYTALSKDCTVSSDVEDIPQFIVLMRSVGNNNQKMLKIHTPQLTVECEPQNIKKNVQIICNFNGRYLNENEENNQIEYINSRKNDLILNLDVINVRFNGYKVWIKLAVNYKDNQCGLCGHYDDNINDENELIMANNEIAPNLAQFHRSYSLSSSYDDNYPICNETELDNFYEQNKRKFDKVDNDGFDEDMNEHNNKMMKEEEWENENFDGTYNEEEDDDEEENYFNNNYEGNEMKMRNKMRGMTQRAPIPMTKMIELEHQICFSQQPIQQCPKGTYPPYNLYREETQEMQQNQNMEQNKNYNENTQTMQQNQNYNEKTQEMQQNQNLQQNQNYNEDIQVMEQNQNLNENTNEMQRNQNLNEETQKMQQNQNYNENTNEMQRNQNLKRIKHPKRKTRNIQQNQNLNENTQRMRQNEDSYNNTQEMQQKQNNKENTTNNNQQSFTTKNVPFICFDRTDYETRQLLQQYKQNKNKQINMNEYSQTSSFIEKVHEPKMCRRRPIKEIDFMDAI